jgi:hypothetical protein
MIGSLIKAHLFGSIKEDKECDYDHTWIDESSAECGDKEYCSVGEDNLNICKYVVIEIKLMQSQVENDLHKNVELQNKLQHALDVLLDEHENVEMLSPLSVKSIVAYVEVRESRIYEVHFLVN